MMLQTDNSAAPLCCNTFTVCVVPRPEATVHFERPSNSIIISNTFKDEQSRLTSSSQLLFVSSFKSLISLLFNGKLCDD